MDLLPAGVAFLSVMSAVVVLDVIATVCVVIYTACGGDPNSNDK